MTWLCSQCGEKFSRFRTRCPSDGQRVIEDLSGQLIGGRYRIRELLGVGGMDSTVWKAWQTGTERVVAVKVLPAAEEAAAKRFARGARIAANLNHPNCTVVHDYGRTEDGKLFLVMEYLNGQVLQEILGPEGMSPEDTIHIVDQVLQALEHAHSQRAVHRDLKPDNLFLSRKNDDPLHVKILDFGISKYVEEDPEHTTSSEEEPSEGFEDLVTEQRQVCGTPQYMAPEQVVGARIDGRTDLYSVGCVMYRMLTGRLPFDGKTRYELYQKHLQEAPRPFREVRPDLVFPDRLELIVMKALSKRPDQRFQSAADMRKALATVAPHDERQRRGVRPRVSLKNTSPQERGGSLPTVLAGTALSAPAVAYEPVSGGSAPATYDPTMLPGGAEPTVLPSPELFRPVVAAAEVNKVATAQAPAAPSPPPLPFAPSAGGPAVGDPTVLPGPMWTLSQPAPQLPAAAGDQIPPPLPAALVRASRPLTPDVEAPGAPFVEAPSAPFGGTPLAMPAVAAPAVARPFQGARATADLAPARPTTNILSEAVVRHPAGRSSLAVAPEVPRSTETEPNRAREAGETRRRRLGIAAVLAGAFMVGVGGVALTMHFIGPGDELAPGEAAPLEAARRSESVEAAVAPTMPSAAGSRASAPATSPVAPGAASAEGAALTATHAGTLAGHALSEAPLAPVAPAPAKVAILIESEPSEATVSAGLEILGQTPLRTELAPGKHELAVERLGYVKQIVTVDTLESTGAEPLGRKIVLAPEVAPTPPAPVSPQPAVIRTPHPQPNRAQTYTPPKPTPAEPKPAQVTADPVVAPVTPPQPPRSNPQVKLLDDAPASDAKKPTIKLLDDDGGATKKPQVKVLEE